VVELIRAQGLIHEYDSGLRAIDGVDFAANAGEMVALLGPNGAGKSTLLKLLAGLLVPTTGSVEMSGKPISDWNPRARAARVAVVPQTVRALPEITVESFVLYGRYAHMGPFGRRGPEDRDAVERALVAADAIDLAQRPLTTLSGGQRQRALIARALAQEAELLLIDEPTNALDPEHQVRTFELIARLTWEGHAAIVVTHELNLASQFSSRVVLLDAGRVAAEGSVSEVLCEDVLAPVYGANLCYGSLPVGHLNAERPFIVPWLNSPLEDDPPA
jgi:iron complex transport system ATP-binding protein